MTFKARITSEEAEHIINVLTLQECTRGEAVFYQSSAYGNFDGVNAIVHDSRFVMRFSCHKLYEKWTSGKLDNSKPLSMSQAVSTILSLCHSLGLPPDRIKCDRFEIGMSMIMPSEPLSYISAMKTIGNENKKETFIDANYEKNRQRTTTRVKTVKKILKIYDKTFEADSKGRAVLADTLRIETIYKRQSISLVDLIDPNNLNRLTNRFYLDWSNANFIREVRGDKGTKTSQLEKATDIIRYGLKDYRDRMRSMYLERRITKKTWETIRVFCDAWYSTHMCHFHTVAGRLERDYLTILKNSYEYARK